MSRAYYWLAHGYARPRLAPHWLCRAFRRSELTGLRFADITETEDGLRIALRQSKTDQEGDGIVKGIPYGQELETCPVRAWKASVQASGISGGQAFRSINRPAQIGASLSDRAIADMIKTRAAAVGLEAGEFSEHSLRAGLATAAAQRGQSERAIARQTGHKFMAVLAGYIREGSLFVDNVAAKGVVGSRQTLMPLPRLEPLVLE